MPHLWIEPELNTLLQLIIMLDQQLAEFSDKSVQVEDADAYGYFDTIEHLIGLAMTVGQTYIATLCGAALIDKKVALEMGPVHAAGGSKAKIVNHAANYWKHNNEWSVERSDRRKLAIEQAFESVGFPVGTDYPLSGVLAELCYPQPASLELLTNILRQWKSAVLPRK